MREITLDYLQTHPKSIFVFGDNLKRYGYRGGAQFRREPNTYGFITKKEPTNRDAAFYKPEEYHTVFKDELARLNYTISITPDKTWLISKIGSGLANKYKIWEYIIKPGLEPLRKYKNVIFLWEASHEAKV